MGIVALDTIPNCRTVDMTLDLCGILVAVALQAELGGRGGDQLDSGDVFVRADLVTTRAPHRDGRVNRLALGFVGMALGALGGISLRVKRHRVLPRYRGNGEGSHEHQPLSHLP